MGLRGIDVEWFLVQDFHLVLSISGKSLRRTRILTFLHTRWYLDAMVLLPFFYMCIDFILLTIYDPPTCRSWLLLYVVKKLPMKNMPFLLQMRYLCFFLYSRPTLDSLNYWHYENYFITTQDWCQLQEAVQSGPVSGFGKRINSLLNTCLSEWVTEYT